MPAFRKKIQAVLGDSAARERLIGELGVDKKERADHGRRKDREARPAQTTTETAASLLDEILAETKLQTGRRGVRRRAARRPGAHRGAPHAEARRARRSTRPSSTRCIAEIDEKISTQIDEILHHPDFQKLESAWRGLKFVVDRTDFRENIQLEVLNGSKEDLLADFEDAPEIPKSGLYKIVYSAEYGQFGGKPYGAIFSNYEFGPGPQDIAAPPEVRGRRDHGARALLRRGRPAVLRH